MFTLHTSFISSLKTFLMIHKVFILRWTFQGHTNIFRPKLWHRMSLLKVKGPKHFRLCYKCDFKIKEQSCNLVYSSRNTQVSSTETQTLSTRELTPSRFSPLVFWRDVLCFLCVPWPVGGRTTVCERRSHKRGRGDVHHSRTLGGGSQGRCGTQTHNM